MSVAYIDTSCLVAIAFRARGATALQRRIEQFDDLVASNLLEAELRAGYKREGSVISEKVLKEEGRFVES